MKIEIYLKKEILYFKVIMFILYVLLVVIALWYIVVQKNRPNHGNKEVPGPRGFPVIGHGLSIQPNNLFTKLSDFAYEYGDIVKVKMFNDTMICLNTAELIRKACNDDPYKKFMNDRPVTFWGENVMNNSESIGLYPNISGKTHSHMRKSFTKAMHVYGEGIKDFEEKVVRELRRLHDVIDDKTGDDFEFIAIMKRSLTNLLSYLMIGEDIPDDDPDVNLFWQLDHAGELMGNPATNATLMAFPFLTKCPGSYKRMFNDAIDARNRVVNKYFLSLKKSYQPGVTRGIVDSLIEEQMKEGTTTVMTDLRIENTVIELTGAAMVTTLSSISNTMLILIHHQDYQEKVQKELDIVIGPDRYPTLKDRADCPLLEAIIMESARYIPIAPLLVPHHSKEDNVFEGFHIPSGSTIFPNVWHVHHDKAVWGDPWTFRPERWMDEDGQLLPSSHPLRTHWMPFGTGRRKCIGEQFARSRLFLYLASLLKTYTFYPTPGKCGSWDPRDGNYVFTILLRTKPFFCKATRRVINK